MTLPMVGVLLLQISKPNRKSLDVLDRSWEEKLMNEERETACRTRDRYDPVENHRNMETTKKGGEVPSGKDEGRVGEVGGKTIVLSLRKGPPLFVVEG